MLLSELTALRGVSGCEDEVRAALRKEAERILGGRGRVFTDTIGNLYACRDAREPGKKRAMVCAHMDEVGFIIRFATEDGLLRFDCVAGVDPRVIAILFAVHSPTFPACVKTSLRINQRWQI